MTYDHVIQRMGQFGRYQRRVYLLLCLPAISCAFHKLAGVFVGAKVNSRCLLPFEDAENTTYLLPPNVTTENYPWDPKTKGFSQCLMYSSNDSGGIHSHTQTIPCEHFVYDRSVYQSSTTSEWNLVCDKAWLRATGDSLFMAGVMLGSMIFGYLSDKYGRRPIFFLSLVMQLVSGVLIAISPEYISFVFFRLIVGSTTSGVFLVAYVIALEMVGPKKRTVAGVGCQLFFTLGYILTGIIAYLIRDWRILQIVITVPSVAFLLYWWFIPESARWLLAKGRVGEAKELLQLACTENGVDLSDETFENLLAKNNGESTPDEKQPSLFDLFRYPNLRRKSLLLFFDWFVNSGTYYGLSWSATNLGGNDYINFEISGLVEIPAYTFLIIMLNKWGRKKIICGCMMLTGVTLMVTMVLPQDATRLRVTCVMIAKLAITSSYGAIYIFTAEQFPTAVRNVGLGASSTFARIGGVIAPYINHLSAIWDPLPHVIYGSCLIIGSLLSLLLPETLNKKLPETIQDGELFGQKVKKEIFEEDKPVIENGLPEKTMM